MTRKKTHEEFVAEVFNQRGDALLLLSKYVGANNRVEVKCNVCGNRWSPIAQSLLKSACSKCANIIRHLKNKKSNVDFIKELKIIHGNNIEPLEEYKNAKRKLLVKCIHGHYFYATPDKLINKKQGCPDCSVRIQGMNHRKNNSDFLCEVSKKGNNEYEVLESYVDVHTKLKFRHNICKNEFNMSPRSFLNKGNRCPLCAKNKLRKLNEEFIKEIYKLYGEEYVVLSEYKSCKRKVKVKHNCGHEYEVTPSNLLKGRGCPKCKSSIGEKEIGRFTEYHKLFYKKEATFDGCVNKNKLRFDFYLQNNLLIEYDGEQHFKLVNFNGQGDKHATKNMQTIQQNDKIKNQYCIDNNIPLIRIPYTQRKNIEYILHNVLIHFGLIENDQDAYDKDIVMKYLVDSNWNHDKYIEENSKKKTSA